MIDRHPDRESISAPVVMDNAGVDAMVRRLARGPRAGVPIVVRLAVEPGTGPLATADECRQMVERLGPHAAAFSVSLASGAGRESLAAMTKGSGASGSRPPLLLCIPTDLAANQADELAESAVAAGFDGLWVDGATHATGRREIGRPPSNRPSP